MTADLLLPPGTGVLLCGHGSRNRRAVDEFAALAEKLRGRLPGVPLDYGYLEFADPVIHAGLERLRAQGVRRILAVPGMLFAAGHAKNDIPSVLNAYAAAHPGLEITYGRELGVDLKLLRAAGARIGEGLAAALRQDIPRHETLLLVVGRGASDPDANANVAKVMRMLWEGMGFGWGEVGYSGVTFPLVAPALAHAAKLGYRRIVVFPYFLFTGVLVKRIEAAAAEAQARHPDMEIVTAPYLSDHPLVIETFLDRIGEMLVGQNLMNCALCKYREQALGFEADVGLKQESHHHHVEGIGGGLENCPCAGDCDGSCRDEGFCRAHGLPWTPLPIHDHHHHHNHHHHSHDAGHALLAGGPRAPIPLALPVHEHSHGPGGHHHHPYPHADHPLGPRTLPKVPGLLARREPGRMNYLRDADAIYARSFEIVRAETHLAAFPDSLREVVVRMVHACGMPEIAAEIAWGGDVVAVAQAALRAGAPVLCDCDMVRAGIARRHLRNEPMVMLNDPTVPELARRLQTTRSAAAVELWRESLGGAVVVIGNAPTALFRLLELLAVGVRPPAAIIATPVGFVGAAESKALLAEGDHGVPYLTVRGRRGGSAMASAALNAIAAGAAA